MSDWTDQLQPASFRGVAFGVLTSEQEFGRRQAVHEYPFRDKPWIEDLGRATRRISVRAFLIENSLIYGGGAAIAQKNALISAVESSGPGALVHPTLGNLNVSVLSTSILDQWDAGRYFEFTLQFLEAGEKIFPAQDTSTTDNVLSAATGADAGAAADFATALTPQLSLGAIAGQLAGQALGPWGDQLTNFGQDATSLFNLAAELPGNFGRFFNSANLSAFSPLSQLASPTVSLDDLVAAASAARTAIATTIATMGDAAANLGLGASSNSPADLAAAAQASVAAALSSAASPADAIRLLTALAAGVPATGANATPTGAAIGDLFRRAAVVALARAGTTYQPSSYQDANAVRGQISDALDAEIETAGDEGDDATFDALRGLRVAVVQDLTARGATLAPIVTVMVAEPTPALVLAQRLYKDADRADQLVSESGCISPLFLPLSFQALAS